MMTSETCSSKCAYNLEKMNQKVEKMTIERVNLLEEIVRLKAEIELIKLKDESKV